MLKTNEDIAPQSREILQTCPATIPTSVKWLNLKVKLRRNFIFKFGHFINFKALFPVVSTDFP